ncbi:MAG: radical SAM protein [Bacteroidales bacterium]|nr:radical SAM protein [Bacteroidales bacterium]MDD3913783.1 radical SAM protein [Bacteroidales bacterium]MDD4633548.1 radical SAM protein [Bacteroidales bacterium]
MKTHYTIPIFIPEKACPFRCLYCNQRNISDRQDSISPASVKAVIDNYLNTIPASAGKRIAFFGGSFTGMSIAEQNQYLDITLPYTKNNLVDEIQLSTRPDYINQKILNNLKQYKVKIIELGAQSLDDEVLSNSGRGHTSYTVQESSKIILNNGFDLGLQMMIGLPGDTIEKSLMTAQKIIDWGAKYTRIYPTLVIKDTDLEDMYNKGLYKPLSLEEAVEWSKYLMQLFNDNGVIILRVGLHPSEGLLTGKNLVAGPFHVSFKELVMTDVWKDRLSNVKVEGKRLVIHTNPQQINYAIGYCSSNKKQLLQSFDYVNFVADGNLNTADFYCSES